MLFVKHLKRQFLIIYSRTLLSANMSFIQETCTVNNIHLTLYYFEMRCMINLSLKRLTAFYLFLFGRDLELQKVNTFQLADYWGQIFGRKVHNSQCRHIYTDRMRGRGGV